MYVNHFKNFANNLSRHSDYKNSISATVTNTFLDGEKELERIKKFISYDTYTLKQTAELKQDFNLNCFYGYENRQLTYHNLLYVSDDHTLKLKLLQITHNSSLAIHFNETSNFNLLTHYYHWLDICKFVKKHVSLYNICERSKLS